MTPVAREARGRISAQWKNAPAALEPDGAFRGNR